MANDTGVRCCEDADMPFMNGTVWYCAHHLVEEFSSRLAEIGINLELDYRGRAVITDIPSRIVWEGELFEYEPGTLKIDSFYDSWSRCRQITIHIFGDEAHPHISGDACMGGNHGVILRYVQQLDFVSAYAQSMAMLCSYNPNDAFHPIVEEDECYECGSTYEVYECNNCGRMMCEDHRGDRACVYCGVRCEDCEQYIPESEILRCESCGCPICDNCAKIVGESVYCYGCEDEAIEDYERDNSTDGEDAGDEQWRNLRLWSYSG
ncbi:MAG: hypothetical protein WC455_30125 [Dehalococcoidia bacterium]|jgi:hypothetical protein